MHGDFHGAAKCLTELVARHQQALTMLGARGVEIELLGIRLVGCELVLAGLSLQIRD